MLELGKAGSGGVERGVVPVLRDGVVVATMSAARWREAATATIDGYDWVYSKSGRELTGRWAQDPDGSARCRARQVSVWKGWWDVDLEGTAVQVRTASWWKQARRYLVDGVQVAESGSTGRLNSRPTLSEEGSLAPAHLVFLLWLEVVVRRRAASADAAVSAV